MVETKNSIYDDEESSTESNEEQQPLTLDATAGTNTADSTNNLSLAGSSEDAEGFTIVSGLTTEEPLQAEVVNDSSTVSVSAMSKSIGLAETESQESFHVDQDEEGQEEEEEKKKRARTVGAGIAAAVVTLPFGLLPAAAVGIGAAYGTKQTGAVGDVCRAAGDVACVAGSKAKEVNNKHQIVDRAKMRVNEVNERHGILDKLKQTWSKLKAFENKHGVLHKTLKGVENILKLAADKIRGNQKPNTEEKL